MFTKTDIAALLISLLSISFYQNKFINTANF